MEKNEVLVQQKKEECKPFLRWTGSKSWLVKSGIDEYLPKEFNSYHECFLGGGSVYFYLKPANQVFLYDTNNDLIETYQQIKDNPELVIQALKKLRNTKEDYYKIRGTHFIEPQAKAAKFIYLNRCSFNGIYRVNPRGEYNVPYGRRVNVDIVTEENLLSVSNVLQNVLLRPCDFECSLENIKEGDLVFLDPPYTVAHEKNGFIEYNQKLFSWEDQLRLKTFISEIIRRKAYFILTNACHSSILELYNDTGKIFKRSRYSKVGGRNKTRGMYNELVICNTVI
ncbi:Dam family site-specific DNA-(adenine-N6)-methyltransferase [Arenibacter sp. BSSL-BM3]|uniref:Site-specific DNA-methyltransferase (adenine-specific) n=1 Tax=Arenibacter arenosicollis TaxID=2762274 RepID=A0ABR7QKU3_9FLAO|nr:Dam family site-specific DNA-(adenine-N6)-methyltransferase [Arenibacter arenosicollis]MBC8767729.1 Dam family site-specific DNA-(adenine-N6)-methyltransferase [Arenibacter arenosicollis]